MDEEASNAVSAKNAAKSPLSGSASAAPAAFRKITDAIARADFNAINTVLHRTRAAHFTGPRRREVAFIERENEQKNLEAVGRFIAKHL